MKKCEMCRLRTLYVDGWGGMGKGEATKLGETMGEGLKCHTMTLFLYSLWSFGKGKGTCRV